jgi:hypothetical protein
MYNKVLKRPMFNMGGRINQAAGTGITSGLDTPKRGLVDGPGGYAGTRTPQEIEAERQERQRDEEDFESKYGKPLLTKQTIAGRTYTPNDTGIEYNKGYKEVIKSGGKDLSNEYTSLNNELENYKSTFTEFEKSANKYNGQFLKIQNAIREIDRKSVV